jgi:hypothetical protein
MPRAVVKDGLIYPLEPLPADWMDGKEVWVEDNPEAVENPGTSDEWYRQLEESVAEIDPKDFEIIEKALKEADDIEKARMRREMGL